MINLQRLLGDFESQVYATNVMVGSYVNAPMNPEKQKEINLYNNLFAEEVGEIFEAIEGESTFENEILIFDGVADTLVVGSHLLGLIEGVTIASLDFTPEGSTAEVGFIDDDAFYEESTKDGVTMETHFASVKAILDKYKETGVNMTFEEVRHVLYKTLQFFVISNFVVADGHYRLLKEVTDSNWSKFPLVSKFSDEEAQETVKEIEAQGRYTGVTYKSALSPSGGRFIFLASSGKYVKCPKTFKEPNIGQFLNQF